MKSLLITASLVLSSTAFAQMNCRAPLGHAKTAFAIIKSGSDGLCEFMQDHVVSRWALDENCHNLYQAALKSPTINSLQCLESLDLGVKSAEEQNQMYEFALGQGSIETILRLKRAGGVSSKPELLFVVTNKDPSVLSYLLNFAADVNADDETGKTALMYAAESGTPEAARRLIELGAKVNQDDSKSFMPLHYAALKNDKKMVEVLLKAGAEVFPNSRYVPLFFAILGDKPENVETLILAGSKVTWRTLGGRTPLIWNSLQPSTPGALEVAKVLVKYKVEVTGVDNSGWNALHHLMLGIKKSQNLELSLKRIKFLIEGGVDKHQKTTQGEYYGRDFKKGLTPYDMAEELGLNEAILEALK